MTDLSAIAEKLALEVRHYGHCRGRVHRPLVDGKTDTRPCDCRHCTTLAAYDAHTAIVQTPAGAATAAKAGMS